MRHKKVNVDCSRIGSSEETMESAITKCVVAAALAVAYAVPVLRRCPAQYQLAPPPSAGAHPSGHPQRSVDPPRGSSPGSTRTRHSSVGDARSTTRPRPPHQRRAMALVPPPKSHQPRDLAPEARRAASALTQSELLVLKGAKLGNVAAMPLCVFWRQGINCCH